MITTSNKTLSHVPKDRNKSRNTASPRPCPYCGELITPYSDYEIDGIYTFIDPPIDGIYTFIDPPIAHSHCKRYRLTGKCCTICKAFITPFGGTQGLGNKGAYHLACVQVDHRDSVIKGLRPEEIKFLRKDRRTR